MNRLPYKLVGGVHGRFEDGRDVTYATGSTILCTPEEAAKLGAKVVPLFSEPEPGPGESNSIAELLEFSVNSVIHELESADPPVDAAFVEAVLEAEKAGAARRGLVDRLGKLIESLRAGEGDGEEDGQ